MNNNIRETLKILAVVFGIGFFSVLIARSGLYSNLLTAVYYPSSSQNQSSSAIDEYSARIEKTGGFLRKERSTDGSSLEQNVYTGTSFDSVSIVRVFPKYWQERYGQVSEVVNCMDYHAESETDVITYTLKGTKGKKLSGNEARPFCDSYVPGNYPQNDLGVLNWSYGGKVVEYTGLAKSELIVTGSPTVTYTVDINYYANRLKVVTSKDDPYYFHVAQTPVACTSVSFGNERGESVGGGLCRIVVKSRGGTRIDLTPKTSGAVKYSMSVQSVSK